MEKQQVKKYTPDTSCTKIPKQLCAPESCNIVEVEIKQLVIVIPKSLISGSSAVQGQGADGGGGQPH